MLPASLRVQWKASIALFRHERQAGKFTGTILIRNQSIPASFPRSANSSSPEHIVPLAAAKYELSHH